jgi:hypothetical protein
MPNLVKVYALKSQHGSSAHLFGSRAPTIIGTRVTVASLQSVRNIDYSHLAIATNLALGPKHKVIKWSGSKIKAKSYVMCKAQYVNA